MVRFSSLRSDLTERLSQVGEVWRILERLESPELQFSKPGLRSLKGLLFVQLYATYEFTVVNSFAATIRELNSHLIPLNRLNLPTLGLALHQEFQKFQTTKESKGWLTRISLLELSHSSAASTILEELFPVADCQYRPPQLEIICQLLALPPGALLPDVRFKSWIEEVVENRNAIAHGREAAEGIGGRISITDLKHKVDQLNELCNHILTTLEGYSSTRSSFERHLSI